MDYDIISNSYNNLHGEEQLNKLKIISNLIQINKKYKLLDIGCGTGISTNYFECKTYGIDPSFNMLKEGNKNLINAKAENLPFKNKTFDIIIAVTSFHNFSDYNKAMEEIKRVGKKNCKLVITLLKKSNKFQGINHLLLKNFKLKQADEEKDIIFYGII